MSKEKDYVIGGPGGLWAIISTEGGLFVRLSKGIEDFNNNIQETILNKLPLKGLSRKSPVRQLGEQLMKTFLPASEREKQYFSRNKKRHKGWLRAFRHGKPWSKLVNKVKHYLGYDDRVLVQSKEKPKTPGEAQIKQINKMTNLEDAWSVTETAWAVWLADEFKKLKDCKDKASVEGKAAFLQKEVHAKWVKHSFYFAPDRSEITQIPKVIANKLFIELTKWHDNAQKNIQEIKANVLANLARIEREGRYDTDDDNDSFVPEWKREYEQWRQQQEKIQQKIGELKQMTKEFEQNWKGFQQRLQRFEKNERIQDKKLKLLNEHKQDFNQKCENLDQQLKKQERELNQKFEKQKQEFDRKIKMIFSRITKLSAQVSANAPQTSQSNGSQPIKMSNLGFFTPEQFSHLVTDGQSKPSDSTQSDNKQENCNLSNGKKVAANSGHIYSPVH